MGLFWDPDKRSSVPETPRSELGKDFAIHASKWRAKEKKQMEYEKIIFPELKTLLLELVSQGRGLEMTSCGVSVWHFASRKYQFLVIPSTNELLVAYQDVVYGRDTTFVSKSKHELLIGLDSPVEYKGEKKRNPAWAVDEDCDAATYVVDDDISPILKDGWIAIEAAEAEALAKKAIAEAEALAKKAIAEAEAIEAKAKAIETIKRDFPIIVERDGHQGRIDVKLARRCSWQLTVDGHEVETGYSVDGMPYVILDGVLRVAEGAVLALISRAKNGEVVYSPIYENYEAAAAAAAYNVGSKPPPSYFGEPVKNNPFAALASIRKR